MSALQDMVDDMVAEHETSPADHFSELGTERRAEGPADDTHVGASRWLSDRSVGQKLWAVSSSNIAVVLLCLIATCLGGYFALEARNERMAISSASIMAERMVADIGEGRLFVQRFAVSGDPNDLVAAQDAFDQTDRDLSRIEEQAIEVAPAVVPQIEELDAQLAELRSRVVAAQASRGTQAQWQAFADSVYIDSQQVVEQAIATRAEIETIGENSDVASQSLIYWLFVAFFVVAAVGISVAWLSARFIGRDVTSALRRMTHVATRLARGEKDIHIPATSRQDEIGDLARCLTAMGAKIEGIDTDVLTITGVSSLTGTTWSVIPDRIEMGSYAVAAAMAGGEVRLTKARADLIGALTDKMIEAGVEVSPTDDGVLIKRDPKVRLKAVDVETAIYPGFATDLQAQFMALMTTAEGVSTVRETIFENRFMHVPELARLGADISVHAGEARVHGVETLHGAQVMATDLRASMCLIIAGLVAEGETTVGRVYHLDRGFERLEQKLGACGAEIRRVKGHSEGME